MTDAEGMITRYRYDQLGRLVTVIFAATTTDEAEIHYAYDLYGNVAAYTDELGRVTRYEYDIMDRLTRVTQVDPDDYTGSGGSNGGLAAPAWGFSYDESGNLVAASDPLGRVTRYQYDSKDRIIATVDVLGGTQRLTYDARGNVVATADELGRTTRYEYDSRGRPVRMTDPLGGVTRFEYDGNNNLVALTDPEGNRTSFAYDSRDRRITEVDPLGNVTRFVYDAANQLRRVVDRLGRVTQYDYNELRQMVGETWKDATGAVANEIVYAHDLVGNLLSAEDDFSAIAFAYDNRYRVKTAENTGTPLGAPEVVLTYAYDETGTRSSVVEAIGGTTQATVGYTYDRLDRMTKVTQSGGNSTAKRVDFGYNALGQWTAISRYSNLAGTALVATSSFTYDSKNRLQNLYHRDSGNAVLAKYLYQYNRADEITEIEDIDGTASYDYDLFGQLTGAEHTNTSNPDEAYDYDLNGNREASHRHGTDYVTGLNNRLLSDGDYAYEYDLEGNLVRRTAIATGAYRVLEWDNRNRLTAVRDYNSSAVLQRETQFSYDALGRRISKSFDDLTDSVDEVLTHFVYDGANVLLDFVDDDGAGSSGTAALTKRYLHGPAVDQVLAQEDSAGVHWLLADHQGSIKDIVDNSGAIEEHRILDAFGNIVSPTNPIIEVRYAFTGRELDVETGLYYYRARYYDATNGRFVSEDPIGFGGGDENLYRYVLNWPLNHIDPSGLVTGQVGIAVDAMLPLPPFWMAGPHVACDVSFQVGFSFSSYPFFTYGLTANGGVGPALGYGTLGGGVQLGATTAPNVSTILGSGISTGVNTPKGSLNYFHNAPGGSPYNGVLVVPPQYAGGWSMDVHRDCTETRLLSGSPGSDKKPDWYWPWDARASWNVSDTWNLWVGGR